MGWIGSSILLLCLLGSANKSLAADKAPGYLPSYLDSLAIAIAPGEGRPYVYSGYGDAFVYGTTADEIPEGHMGFTWGEYKLWSDFQIFGDGKRLNRAAARVDFKPHVISFQWDSGIQLDVHPLYRDRCYLLLRCHGAPPGNRLDFFLLLEQPPKSLHDSDDLLSANCPQGATDSLWIGLGCKTAFARNPLGQPLSQDESEPYGQMARQGEALHVQIQGAPCEIAVLYARSREALTARWKKLRRNPESAISDRNAWLLEEINRSYFRCQDEEINKAVNWVKISLAQLWAENETALWAGLPWFNDCWGRDTFISLAGACLVQGKFAQAKTLLERFARWQCRDSTSMDYGRIPNRARFGDISYNTADGTPWFVKGVYDYGLYSGDVRLWQEYLSPGGAVWRANEGTLKYHTDSLGFLTHGDAETWMDAVGPDGPWTPRGNRAVEVQALWLEQIERSLDMVSQIRDPKFCSQINRTTTGTWELAKVRLWHNGQKYFLRPDSLGMYDHLNSDGMPDQQIRPNQLFVASFDSHLLLGPTPYARERALKDITETVRDSLTYRHGVASLAPSDSNFHPYHQYPLYPKDAAYHNGVVWTWLSGPYKSATKNGWLITKNEMDQILHRGAPGTLPELLDAVPREGGQFPQGSGTVSQTWSLAEFLRTWYQDYVGLCPVQMPQNQNRWYLEPHLPTAWGSFSAQLHLKREEVRFEASVRSDSVRFRFIPQRSLEDTIELALFFRWPIKNLHAPGRRILLTGRQTLEIPMRREGDWIYYTREDGQEEKYQLFLSPENPDGYLQPIIPSNLKALQSPDHLLLSGREIKAENPSAVRIANLSDPEFDDVGDGGYVYPTEPHFRPGILDLTHFQVKADSQRAYFKLNFRNLVQPGWHPEYGFQLTFIAIALRTESPQAITRREVGRNSGWSLSEETAADRFIYVSGPLLVEDGSGMILCEYIPQEPQYALGNAAKREISFALPRSILPGDSEEWRFTVLVGSQDDHGGAGLGEFRAVNEQPSRWAGGGGVKGKPNVYDSLIFLP